MFEDFRLEATHIPDDEWIKWNVKLYHKDRLVLETEYSQGIGHIPNYNAGPEQSGWKKQYAKTCCQTGKYQTGPLPRFSNGRVDWWKLSNGIIYHPKKPLPPPKLKDVMYCLVMDSDALEYTFSDWCHEFGYDDDSMKAKKIYDTCIEQAIKLKQYVNLEKAREYYEDY